LVSSLEKRFSAELQSGSPNTDPLFLAASLLDPNTAFYLRDEKDLGAKAIKAASEALSDKRKSLDPEGEVELDEEAEQMETSAENLFGFGEVSPPRENLTRGSNITEEIGKYFDAVLSTHTTGDPFVFWLRYKGVSSS
jgi:hypothetical protein